VRPELFLSAAGAYTGVHRDLEDGASCVFVGRRRFRLWSPDQAATLYAMPNLHPKFQACFVDARRPDLDRFPRFADAVALEVTLEHGEALYLPFGWFHDVFVLEHGMTVRFDYPHDLHRLVA
jgi:ribosomal protein L16 Arg81 hydroxylase